MPSEQYPVLGKFHGGEIERRKKYQPDLYLKGRRAEKIQTHQNKTCHLGDFPETQVVLLSG
jgi:hypothetical protein